MSRPESTLRALLAFLLTSLVVPAARPASTEEKAFPGAEGWAATTPGGRGGRILKVTTLKATGPGSFLAALETQGPRIIVFEVGGVIDLDRRIVTIKEPFLTIAGQTAPSPGITFIRGGFLIGTHDVVVRHIRVRPGEAGHAKKSGWEPDGMSTLHRSYNVIVDHCSFSWAIDENLSMSSKPFDGSSPEEWRRHASRRVTFSHNIVAEGLDKATHTKVAHSKGSLIMDNCTEVLLLGNLFASNVERNPQIKGGTWTAVVNNVIYNPVVTAIHYHLNKRLWQDRPPVTGRADVVGNILRHGPDTMPELALFRFVGEGDLELHTADNLAFNRHGQPIATVYEDNRYGGRIRAQATPVHWPAGLQAMPAADVQEHVLRHAGARPWDRDAIDARIVRQTRDGTGRVIDSEQEMGGYPTAPETRQPFNPDEWVLRTMTRRDDVAQTRS
jgi:hypothetical protein